MPKQFNINGTTVANTPGMSKMLEANNYLPNEAPNMSVDPLLAQASTPPAPAPIGDVPLVGESLASVPSPAVGGTSDTPGPTTLSAGDFAAPPVKAPTPVEQEKTGMAAITEANKLDKSYQDLEQAQIETARLGEEASAEAAALYNKQQQDMDALQVKRIEAQETSQKRIDDAQVKYTESLKELDDYAAEGSKEEKITLMSGVDNKAMAYIGVVMSGIGAGLSGSNQNAAMNVLMSSMNAEIGQQKRRNQMRKEGLIAKTKTARTTYDFMLAKFNNEQMAEAATRKFILDKTSQQINVLALKYKQPEIQANLQESLAKLDLEKSKIDATIQSNMYAQSLKNEGKKVKGIGVARTPEDAQKLNDAKIAEGEAINILNELRGINKETFNYANLTTIGRAKILVAKLKAASRIAVSGGGNISEYEQKLLEDISPNPTDIFSREKTNIAKFDMLEKSISDKVSQRAQQTIVNWESPETKKFYSTPGLRSREERKVLAGMKTFKPKNER